MHLWIGKQTLSDPHLNLYLQRERIPADVAHHLLYSGHKISDNKWRINYMDIIKKIWKEVSEKPLWAIAILMVAWWLFA
tara:strand:- start:278 stop:514 length:237 start_codon:yes stop_codon:yes gene_type:complete